MIPRCGTVFIPDGHGVRRANKESHDGIPLSVQKEWTRVPLHDYRRVHRTPRCLRVAPGVREYADNYHASITRKGWEGTDAEFAEEIDKYCTEARDRFHAGDVPGERVSADPKAMTEKLAKRFNVDPATLMAFLESQAAQGRAA